MNVSESEHEGGCAERFMTCLWYESGAEEAARFYCSLFPDAVILLSSPMATTFRLGDQRYMALNGGPHYRLSPAASVVVECDDQAEIDRLWAALGEGGAFSRCGWLTDRFGLTWQVIPRALGQMMSDPDPAKVQRVVAAFMPMDKLDLATLEAAFRG